MQGSEAIPSATKPNLPILLRCHCARLRRSIDQSVTGPGYADHPKRRRTVPYLLSIQSDALDFLDTRIVVPLVTERSFGPRITFLHPLLDVEEHSVVLAMNELVALDRATLGRPVANLQLHASEIVTALDYLISGY